MKPLIYLDDRETHWFTKSPNVGVADNCREAART
jgi:hypothetical protein